jgi:hypothetical protein
MLSWIRIGMTSRAPVPMNANSRVWPMPLDRAGATRMPLPIVRAEPNLFVGSFTVHPVLGHAQRIA